MAVALTVVLAVVSVAGLLISVWAFVVSVLGGSWLVAMAAVLLFVASMLAAGLAYSLGHQGWSRRQDKTGRRGITLEPGQSLVFRLMPGMNSYVAVRPEPGQWTTTRIDPVHEGDAE